MIVGNQMKYSIFINMIIGIVHGLFYNPQKDGTRDFYEARTRKVLSYSNALASLGNIAYAIGTEDWRKLDVGGIIITIGRLFSDIRFITKLKKDFIQGEIDKVLEQTIKNIDAEFEQFRNANIEYALNYNKQAVQHFGLILHLQAK